MSLCVYTRYTPYIYICIHIYIHTIPHHNIPYHCIALHIAHCITLHYIAYIHTYYGQYKYIHVCMYIYIYVYIYICVWDTRHWGPTNPTRIIRLWNVHLEELHLFRLNVICLECDKISCASAGEAVPQLFSALRMGWFRFRISDLHVVLSLCVCIYICIRPGQGCCPGKCVLTSQSQCFLHFGISAEWQNSLRDLFPKHKTLNPKT